MERTNWTLENYFLLFTHGFFAHFCSDFWVSFWDTEGTEYIWNRNDKNLWQPFHGWCATIYALQIRYDVCNILDSRVFHSTSAICPFTFCFLLLCLLVFSLIHIFHILLQYCQLKNLMYAANNAFYHFMALNGFSSQSK